MVLGLKINCTFFCFGLQRECCIAWLLYTALRTHGAYFWLGVRYCFMRLSLTVDSSRSMSEPSFSLRDSCGGPC